MTSLSLGAANRVLIYEKSATAQSQVPIQFGRVFHPGEIAQFPQALVNGSPVATQADVKSRYADGSVKHAILSFILHGLSANGSVTVTFANQSFGNNTPLTKTEMLTSSFNFDAVISLTNGTTTVTASARTMLNADKYTYWTQGPIATTVIIADHSFARAYDIGFDANRSFRPIFHATFWPVLNKVRVRFIGEISNTEVLQDQTYNLTLTVGQAYPDTVYFQNGVVHCQATRWTKEYWIGGAPSSVAINHHTPYLIQTRLLPSFDTTKTISESSMASDYARWLSKDRSLFAQAYWSYKAMGTAGGRPEIGPMTAWTVRYCYTWDNRMKEIAFGQADNTGVWPMHFREGSPTKTFLRTDATVKGLGRVIAITGRPTLHIGDGNNYLNYSHTAAADKITPLSATSCEWKPDCCHQPELLMVPYALTGDFWYLEQAWFWASWSAAHNNGAATTQSYGRGPTGAEGGVTAEIRGQAWKLRSRCQTAWITPDSTAEKQYFTQLIHDAIAILEGEKNITGSPYQGNACWNWANIYQYKGAGTLPPLRQWQRGSSGFAQWSYGIDTNVTKEAVSNFESHYFLYSIGRAKELGYATDRLVSYFAPCYIGQLTAPGYNPFLISNGRLPTVRKSDNQFFTTWSDMKTGYQSSWQTKSSFDVGSAEDYTFLAMAATSMVAYEPGGNKAWAFMRDHALNAAVLNNDPRWAIIPRDSARTAVGIETVPDIKTNAVVTALFTPCNPAVVLRVSNAGDQALRLFVYDIRGRIVEERSGRLVRGTAVWTADGVPSGIFLAQAKMNRKTIQARITLIK